MFRKDLPLTMRIGVLENYLTEHKFHLDPRKGTDGARGERGPQGEPGVSNIPGPQGPQGERGEKGDKGDKGDPGVSDIPGPRGERGEKGDSVQGPQGVKGDRGEKAEKGDIVKIVIGQVTNGETPSANLRQNPDGGYVLDLVLQRGQRGPEGLRGYSGLAASTSEINRTVLAILRQHRVLPPE